MTLLLLAVGCSSGNGGSPGTGGAGGRGGAAGGGAGTGGSDTAGAAGTATGGNATAARGVTGGAGAGGAAWLTPPTVPATLAVPNGATLAIHDHAIGQQVYTCTAMSSGGAGGGGARAARAAAGTTTYSWVLKQPDAKLYDMERHPGRHARRRAELDVHVDGSIANGTKIAQADSPQSAPSLGCSSKRRRPVPRACSATITYVQRANTIGGKAPATGCDSTTVNTDKGVDYSADYYFFTGGGPGAAWLTPPANVPAAIAVPAGTTVKAARPCHRRADLHLHRRDRRGRCRWFGGSGAGGATTYAGC